MDPQKIFDDIKKALEAAGIKLDPNATPEDIVGFVKKLAEFASMAPGAPAEGGMTPEAMPGMEAEMQKTVACAKAFTDVATLVGANAAPADVIAKVTALSNAAAAAPDAARLNARIAELERAQAEAKADEFIRANENRIQPVHRTMYRDMLVRDFENTAKIVETLPAITPAPAPSVKTRANGVDIPADVQAHYREALGTSRIHNKKKEA